MDNKLKKKEKELEIKRVENDIESQKAEIAQKKALEAEMKARYGSDWKKVLGLLKVRANSENIQSLYSVNPELRNLAIPRRLGGK